MTNNPTPPAQPPLCILLIIDRPDVCMLVRQVDFVSKAGLMEDRCDKPTTHRRSRGIVKPDLITLVVSRQDIGVSHGVLDTYSGLHGVSE